MTDGHPDNGEEYQHPDGSVEIVFATEGDRILTVTEYPSLNTFSTAVEEAVYHGIDENIAALPPASVFRESVPDDDQADRSADESE